MSDPSTDGHGARPALHRPRVSGALGALVSGLVLTAVAVAGAWQAAQGERIAQQIAVADQLVHRVDEYFNNLEHDLRALDALFASQQEITAIEFDNFIERTGSAQQSVLRFGWSPWVPADQREAYTARSSYDGRPLRIQDLNGSAITAMRESLPLTYIYPRDRPYPALGFDQLSEPQRRHAITTARAARDMAVTVILPVTDSLSDQKLAIAYLPVFGGPDQATAPDGLLGFASAAILPTELGQALVQGVNEDNVRVAIFDVTEAAAPILIYANAPLALRAIPTLSGSQQRDFMRAGRHWQISTRPSDSFGWAALIVPGGIGLLGLLMTLATAAQIWRLSRIRARLQDEVDEREHAQAVLRRRTELEALIATLSADFISRGIAQVDAAVRIALTRLMYAFEADHAAVYLLDDEAPHEAGLAFESCRPDCPPLPEAVRRIDLRNKPWLVAQIQQQTPIRVARPSQLDDTAADELQGFIEHGFRAGLTLPLRFEGQTIGTVSFSFRNSDVNLREDNADLLALVAQMFANALQRQRLTRQRDRMEKRLDQLTSTDPITELPNLAALRHWAAERADGAGGSPVNAVIVLGIDRLERIRSSYGERAANDVVREAAARLRRGIAGDCLLGHLGAGVFALVCAEAHDEVALAAKAQQLSDLLTAAFSLAGGEELRPSVSIGVAIDTGEQESGLIQRAELAMHEARTAGSNETVFYAHERAETAAERLSLESALKKAIDDEALILHYQPIFEMHTRRFAGAEALLRWNDPRRGAISPAVFIPIAEEIGLMGALGDLVFRRVAADWQRWREAGFEVPTIAVNVSAQQFHGGLLGAQVRRLLATPGFNARSLELEITEGALASDLDGTIRLLQNLRELGLHLSVDDFGTGYSSLSYLKHFPLDTLKIDQTFVRDLSSGSHAEAIISATVRLARSLRLDTVAEGVETEAQMQFMQQQRCERVQGFLLARPMPPDALRERYSAGPGSSVGG